MNLKLTLATAVTLVSLLAAGTASASVPAATDVLAPVTASAPAATLLVAHNDDWECEWDFDDEEFYCDWEDDYEDDWEDDDWEDDWED
jgi:hypothetical protein